jgi:DNA-binding transcriptional regulator YhcF (GntR family)
VSFQIDLDPSSVIPLYVQLRSRLEYMIGTGHLSPGTQIPSVRELATRLEIASATVQQAYRELQQKGLVEAQRGRGTFVSQIAPPVSVDSEHTTPLHNLIDDLIAQSQSQGFSLQEIRLAFEDRIALQESGLQIGFVGIRDAMHKYATLIQGSLANLRASVSSIPLEDLRASPESAHLEISKYDLLVALLFHYRETVDLAAGTSIPVLPIISELSHQTLESIALLPPDARIGLICHRTSFNNYLATIRLYRPSEQEILACDPEDNTLLTQLLENATVILHTTVLTSFAQEMASSNIPLIELKHVPNSSSLDRVRALVKKMLGQE